MPILNYKKTTPEYRNSLFEKARNGDKTARNELVELNAPLVRSVIFKFYPGYNSVDREDLFQVGCIGLMSAIDEFDISQGNQFSTFAVARIWGKIKRYTENNTTLAIPHHVHEKMRLWAKTAEALTTSLNRDPTHKEICEKLAISEGKMVEILSAFYNVHSLDEFNYGDDETICPYETVADATDIYEDIDLNTTVKAALERLRPIEREVIFKRFYQSSTLEEIGKQVGVTRERIRQIEKMALNKLKGYLKGAV